jgi:hypothetical protein
VSQKQGHEMKQQMQRDMFLPTSKPVPSPTTTHSRVQGQEQVPARGQERGDMHDADASEMPVPQGTGVEGEGLGISQSNRKVLQCTPQ